MVSSTCTAGGDVQVSTIKTGAGGAINVVAAKSFRAVGDGLGVDSFPRGGVINDPSLISFLQQQGFSSEQLRNARFSVTGQFDRPLSGIGVVIVDSSLRSYSLAVNLTESTPDVPVINIRVGNAQQEIVNQLIDGRGRIVILGDSQQSFRVGPFPNNGLVFVPASPSDRLENYNPATNNFAFKFNAAQPLIYPSALFPLNASGIAGAIAVDDGTNERLLSSLQYRSFVPLELPTGEPNVKPIEGSNPPVDPPKGNPPPVDPLTGLRQRFQAGEDGQVAQRQLNTQKQNASCESSSTIAAAPSTTTSGTETRSPRATTATTAANTPCASATQDDAQILKILGE
jgi:hypothetical protein